jgi:hypothetical protein
MADLPTMFSYNALISTRSGHLVLHHRDKRLAMTKSGSTLTLVGSTTAYEIRPSGLAILQKEATPTQAGPIAEPTASVASETSSAEPDTTAEPSALSLDGPKTYYIKATSGGRVLSTDDFAIASYQLWNTKPMPRGTRIAVAVTRYNTNLWSVPGSTELSFVPINVNQHGNIGDILVAATALGNTPLWRLEGPLADGYLFYTLLQDLDRPTIFTTF